MLDQTKKKMDAELAKKKIDGEVGSTNAELAIKKIESEVGSVG